MNCKCGRVMNEYALVGGRYLYHCPYCGRLFDAAPIGREWVTPTWEPEVANMLMRLPGTHYFHVKRVEGTYPGFEIMARHGGKDEGLMAGALVEYCPDDNAIHCHVYEENGDEPVASFDLCKDVDPAWKGRLRRDA